MTAATNTTAGEVVLGGDLSGTADLPALRATGVAPGSYNPVKRVSVDSKGRVTSAGTFTTTSLSETVAYASSIQRGLVKIGQNISVSSGTISVATASSTTKGVFQLTLPLATDLDGEVYIDYSVMDVATTSSKGIMQVGSGLSVSGGVLSYDVVQDATTSSKGIVQVGANLNVSGGVLSAGFGDATTSALGIVSVDAPLQVSGGVVSMPFADYTTKGIVRIGAGFNVSGGVVNFSYGPAGSTQLGFIQLGPNFENVLGLWSLPIASTTKKGLMMVGSGLQTIGGVLSTTGSTTDATDATTSSKGVVQIGSGLSVSSGVVSLNLPDATTSVKGIMQVGSGIDVAAGVISVTHPDTTTSSKGIVQVGTGLSVSSGVMSLDTPADATANSKGIIQVSSSDPYLSVSSGVLSVSVPDATTSSKGVVQIAANGGIEVSSGVISSRLATTTLKGIVQPGSGVSISGNQISVTAATTDTTTGSKGIAQFDSTYFNASSGLISLKSASGTTTFGVVSPADSTNLTISAGDLDVGTNIPKLNAANTYTKAQASALVTDAYSATYTPDFSASNTFGMVLTGNVSLANPTNAVPGGVYTIILTQDATGGRTLTLSGSAYKTNQTITLSTAANKRDVLTLVCKSSTEIFVLFTPGF